MTAVHIHGDPSSLTMEHTHVYLGKKSNALSIFLRNRSLVSVDGRPWPILEGRLVQESCSTNSSPLPAAFVRALCVLRHKTLLGTFADTILYSESKRINEEFYEEGKRKLSFSFDFGSQSLPPTARINAEPPCQKNSKSLGVHWIIIGFLSPTGLFQDRIHEIAMPFTLAYQHTQRVFENRLPPPIPGSLKRTFLHFMSRSKNTIQLSASFIQPPVYEPLLAPLPDSMEDPKSLKFKIEISQLLPSQAVDYICVNLTQHIQVFTPQKVLPQDTLCKTSVELTSLRPAPRYDIEHESSTRFIFNLSPSLKYIKSKKSHNLAVITPFHSAKDVNLSQLVPSTWEQEDVCQNSIFVKVNYTISTHVFVRDLSANTRLKEFIVNVPVILSYGDPNAFAITLRSSQIGSSVGSLQNSSPGVDNFALTTVDAIGSFISELMDDLNASTEMLNGLVEAVKRRPNESSGPSRVVTTTADHVDVIQGILTGLDEQSQSFATCNNKLLPLNPVPVNLLILELELLIETLSTTATDYSLLDLASEYLVAYKALVKGWMNLSGKTLEQGEESSHFEKHQTLLRSSSELSETLSRLSQS